MTEGKVRGIDPPLCKICGVRHWGVAHVFPGSKPKAALDVAKGLVEAIKAKPPGRGKATAGKRKAGGAKSLKAGHRKGKT